MRRRCAGLVLCAGMFLPASCKVVSTFVEYSDALEMSPQYTIVTRGTAQVGGFVGKVAGYPVNVAALPVTYPVYLIQKESDPDASFASIALLPSFALERVGRLVAVPVSLVELGVYGLWVPRDTWTEQEREAHESALDEYTLPRYPVKPIYPPPVRR